MFWFHIWNKVICLNALVTQSSALQHTNHSEVRFGGKIKFFAFRISFIFALFVQVEIFSPINICRSETAT